jgi:sigma-E factor negative regulatory protein RseC
MAEFGQVVKVLNGDVRVRLNRQEACAKCGACTAGLESKDMFIEATNIAKAKMDDWVEIQLEEANFIKAVAIMYGIPLIGLLLGLALGSLAGNYWFPGFADILGIIAGLLGAGLSFLLIHLNEDKFKTKKFKPKAVRRVKAEEVC